MKSNWMLEESFVDRYTDACREAVANDNAFKVFRQHPVIHTVIENGNEEWLRKVYSYLLVQYPTQMDILLDWFLMSDMVGGPKTYEVETGIFLSPTTVRYMLTLSYLYKFFGNLNGKKIVEIGGGYGGQYKIIRDAFTPKEYIIYDLDEALELQTKFVHHFYNTVPTPARVQHIPEIDHADLVISWCSWSELDFITRVGYVERVIGKADHFLIASNYNVEEDLQVLQVIGPVKVYNDEFNQNIIYK